MLPELSILKLFLSYSLWNKYSVKLTSKDFPEDLQELYLIIDVFHKEKNEEHVDLQLLDLANLFFARHSRDNDFYKGVFKTLETYSPNESTVVELINSLRKQKLLRELSLQSYAAAEGKKSTLDVTAMLQELEQLDNPVVEEEEYEFVTSDLQTLLNHTIGQPGLKFRLNWLNRALGSLRKGNFGFIFARPESGKTTFLASEVTYMAEQLADDAGPIIWFNNEQQGEEVGIRIYQASLGLSTQQFYSDIAGYTQEYLRKTKDKIKIVDSASINKKFVEALCRKYKPSLIIFDQIDKIQGFDSDREDLRLGAIYIWARELAKQYCPVIGVCQAGGTGENVRYLHMAHVANATTAKQAEADWILGIGVIHDTGWENIRFLNISKNKLPGDSDSDASLRHGKGEVLINASIARYEDIN